MSLEEQKETEVRGLDPWGLNQVEELLGGVTGVEALKVVPDGHGGVDEIHVISTTDIGPKQVVRNIESALLAEFGLQIDHRKISVAQVERPDLSARTVALEDEERPEVEEPLSVEPYRRLLLEDLQIDRNARDRVACRVTLIDGEEVFKGESEGPDFSRSRLEVAGRALLSALNEATLDDVTFRLEGVDQVEASGRPLVVVVVLGQERRRSVTLPGVSLIEDSPEEAAVLACLQATNRWAGAV